MKITSAKFMRGVVGPDELLEDGTSQVAFIGRSNVGKSSVINSLTGEKNLARTSAFPGRTREINIFWINKALYLLDLPGYGYAKASKEMQERIIRLVHWYLVRSPYVPKKVALIIDANVGPTSDDMEMIESLEEKQRDIIIVANKIDKIKKSEYKKQLGKIQKIVGNHNIIPYSAKMRIGVRELLKEVLEPVSGIPPSRVASSFFGAEGAARKLQPPELRF